MEQICTLDGIWRHDRAQLRELLSSTLSVTATECAVNIDAAAHR